MASLSCSRPLVCPEVAITTSVNGARRLIASVSGSGAGWCKSHAEGRAAAGARTVSARLNAKGETIGRYKAARLMAEASLESRQPSYKKTGGVTTWTGRLP